MLKICEQKGVGDEYTVEQYYTLSQLAMDPVKQVWLFLKTWRFLEGFFGGPLRVSVMNTLEQYHTFSQLFLKFILLKTWESFVPVHLPLEGLFGGVLGVLCLFFEILEHELYWFW